MKIEETLCIEFVKKQKTLILAESCTGGTVACKLTTIPGASQYFLGSFVAYSDKLKQIMLNVSEKTLKKFGAVSKEVVIEMVKGALLLSKADYGIAISGIAGPTGGTKEKPVGTVWVAIAKKGKEPEVGLVPLKGVTERTKIIRYVAKHVLIALRRKFQLEEA